MSPNELQHFDLDDLSVIFKVPKSWFEKRTDQLPCTRLGHYVRFSAANVLAISEMFAVDPHAAQPAVNVPAALADLRPARRGRKAS